MTSVFLCRYRVCPFSININYLRLRYVGIFYTIHLDENVNVSDFNSYIAGAYRRTVKETIELAKKLQIPVLRCTCPEGYTLPCRKERSICSINIGKSA